MRRWSVLWLLPVASVALQCGGRTGTSTFNDAPSSKGGGDAAGAGALGGSEGVVSGTAGMPATAGSTGAGGSAGGAGSGGSAGFGGTSTAGQGGARGTEPVTGLALGAFHTCSLFAGGNVRCWGLGEHLGYGNTETIGDNETPRVVGDVELGGPARQISAGWYHTCARLEGGTVRCWGNGYSGQLGYASTEIVGDNESPASMGDVMVGGRALQVEAGATHTCALLETRRVRCWGENDNGQLGYGHTERIGDDETPASAGDVDVGAPVMELAVGRAHTCVLLNGGNVRCWGHSAYGQLGYAEIRGIGDDETPASAGDIDLGAPAMRLALGGNHSCALLRGGRVRCWGGAGYGQLGYGNTENVGDNETPAVAGNVDVGGAVEQLAAGDHGTCALLRSGAVRCWGEGEQGQLGYGNGETIGDNETPAFAGDVDVGWPASTLEMGFLHTCAAAVPARGAAESLGAVRCWGRGGLGALGYGDEENVGDDEPPAVMGDVELE